MVIVGRKLEVYNVVGILYFIIFTETKNKDDMVTLTGLIPLYQSIRQNNLTYALFDFKKNGIIFHVMFDIEAKPYFKLIIIAQGSKFELQVEVKPGFIVNPYIDTKKYKQLTQLLNLKYDPNNKFSPMGFFEEFNSKIPQSYTKPDKAVLLEFAVNKYHIEKKKKVYFRGFINWKKRERSEKNTEKTRLLLPLISECIKDKIHISVAYTDVPNNIEYVDVDDPAYHLGEDFVE